MGAASIPSLTSQNQFGEVTAVRRNRDVASRDSAHLIDHQRLGRVLAGRYRLEQLLGQGAMGEVFRARDLKRQQWCAVKLVYPGAEMRLQAHRRFVQEANVIAQLIHPNIVEVREFNEDADGTKFLVMELLEGVDLQTVLSRTRRLPLVRALQIVKGVGAALQYAHALGVVHRDVKPDNIFLTQQRSRDGRTIEVPKMLDFGLAKLFDGEWRAPLDRANDPEQPVTRGIVVDTPAYLPPEVAMGQAGAACPRADQWSLAVVAYQMLAGQLPYDHKNPYQICQLICNGEHPLLEAVAPGLPAHVYSTIERALANDPEARFPSITDFLRALENLPLRAAEKASAQTIQEPERMTPEVNVLKTVQYSAEELRALTRKSRRDSEPIPKEQEHIPTAPYSDSLQHSDPAHLPPELREPEVLETAAIEFLTSSAITPPPRLPGMRLQWHGTAEPAQSTAVSSEERTRPLPRLPPPLPAPSHLPSIQVTLSDFAVPRSIADEESAQIPILPSRTVSFPARMIIALGAALLGIAVLLAIIAFARMRTPPPASAVHYLSDAQLLAMSHPESLSKIQVESLAANRPRTVISSANDWSTNVHTQTIPRIENVPKHPSATTSPLSPTRPPMRPAQPKLPSLRLAVPSS